MAQHANQLLLEMAARFPADSPYQARAQEVSGNRLRASHIAWEQHLILRATDIHVVATIDTVRFEEAEP